jgi:8-oxo-dGTP pyrophosphatase MutT (NUDIX family)
LSAPRPDPAAVPQDLRAVLRARLAGSGVDHSRYLTVPGLAPDLVEGYGVRVPTQPTPAAVLVPIVDHAGGLTVLLTERAADLRHHPGQISFPGGRLEPGDSDAVAAALRETEEEIGLARSHVEVIGFLPDYLLATGYRVTPVVALVTPGFRLALDQHEVAGVFEMPLAHLLDPANHRRRERQIGATTVEVHDIPFGARHIWGATAAMLMTLCALLTDPHDR